MPKKYPIDLLDLETFKTAVKGAKPLIHNKVRLAPPQKKYLENNKVPHFEEEIVLHDKNDLNNVSGEEFISYKQASISHKILRKLRKGQYNVEATLDLHGMTVDNAKHAVQQFLQGCIQHDIRVAVVIHGKGKNNMAILKNKLNQWLRDVHVVLAFCSATSLHGRHGAIYVLLKRSLSIE